MNGVNTWLDLFQKINSRGGWNKNVLGGKNRKINLGEGDVY